MMYLSKKNIAFLELNKISTETSCILMRVANSICTENPVTALPVAGSLTITVKCVSYSDKLFLSVVYWLFENRACSHNMSLLPLDA